MEVKGEIVDVSVGFSRETRSYGGGTYAYNPMARKAENVVLAAIVLCVIIRGGMVALDRISESQR